MVFIKLPFSNCIALVIFPLFTGFWVLLENLVMGSLIVYDFAVPTLAFMRNAFFYSLSKFQSKRIISCNLELEERA